MRIRMGNHLALAALLEFSTLPIIGGDLTITFMATPTEIPSSPGHCFVCLEVPLSSGTKEDCFGFYPKSFSSIFNGEGTVENEITRAKNPDRFSKVSISFRHAITEDQRRAIYREIEKWSGANYSLIVNNCGDMAFAVAKVSGLLTPNRSTILRPTEFIAGLMDCYWNGQWTSSDPSSRFSLVREGTGFLRWTEQGGNGVAVTKVVPFAPQNDLVTIYRDNTGEVLDLLGYQATVKSEILAAHPQPSFMKLRRVGDLIEGTWFGLVAIKDAHAHLKELKQPGTTPGKTYSFNRIP